MTDEVLDRLAEVERKVDSLVDVCSAVADDTLRMCLALDETAKALGLPGVPWDLATKMVDFHHAQRAAREGLKSQDGVSPEQQMEKLKQEILQLREAYRASFQGMGKVLSQP
jgi:hypothetical protein